MGLIALLLVAPNYEIPDDLNRMSQGDLDRCLTKDFEKYRPLPSSNAKGFIQGCLRVSPDDRISTAEAESHDWLHTPQKHIEFFRRLDQRMLADWSLEKHLKPLPWELQSLKDALERPDHCDQAAEQGDRDNDEEEPMKSGFCGDSAEVSAYFPKPDPDEEEITLVSIPTRPSPPPKWEDATTPPKVRSAGTKALSTTRSQNKRKRRTTKIPNGLFLPLTGLERHLHPVSTGTKRETILEELKKTNSMFLKEGVGSKGSSPVGETLRLPAKPNVKKQRNKRRS